MAAWQGPARYTDAGRGKRQFGVFMDGRGLRCVRLQPKALVLTVDVWALLCLGCVVLPCDALYFAVLAAWTSIWHRPLFP